MQLEVETDASNARLRLLVKSVPVLPSVYHSLIDSQMPMDINPL